MNGALFAAYRVLTNSIGMVGLTGTTHSPIRKLGMCLFMLYFLTNQIMSFFLIGSFYVSIKLFFKNYFQQLTNTPEFFSDYQALWNFFNDDGKLGFTVLYSYFYIILLIFTILVSLATPIDRAMSYFRFVSVIFSIMIITSLVGISFFLAETGFYPEEKKYDIDKKQWIPLGTHHFSILTLAGVIMLGVYTLPIILRPIDFMYNLP